MRKVLHLYYTIPLIILLILCLSSCSHTGRRDGAPNFYVDESKIHNAVPKPEPLAKRGNMRSYVVKGKRYYTLPTSKNFQQVGTASWYGTMFHAQRTSSGEPYNMLAMTAAHTTLPLPTYVEVTNLNNHRKVIVKVNDRGPFNSDFGPYKSKRIIDLSYVAAKKLHMLGRGSAPVRIRAIDPYTYGRHFELARRTPSKKHEYKPLFAGTNKTYKPLFAGNEQSHSVYLHVGSFHSKTRAIKFKQRLISMLSEPVSISKGKLYRVKIGPIKDFTTVNKISSRLKRLGIQSNKVYGA